MKSSTVDYARLAEFDVINYIRMHCIEYRNSNITLDIAKIYSDKKLSLDWLLTVDLLLLFLFWHDIKSTIDIIQQHKKTASNFMPWNVSLTKEWNSFLLFSFKVSLPFYVFSSDIAADWRHRASIKSVNLLPNSPAYIFHFAWHCRRSRLLSLLILLLRRVLTLFKL